MSEQTATEPLADLSAAGVSIWLDDLSRERLTSGNLAKLVEQRNVVGVTTNPTIFQKALANGTAYEDQMRDLALRDVTVEEAVRALTTYDVRWACDLLAPIADSTGGEDGRVSIEVDPRMAKDADRTVAEARALSWLVDRPNVLIKIPATEEGLDAITRTIAEGISVNVTLIFSLDRYRKVIDAYLDGLERARDAGHDLSEIRSVASFFVSRVDTEIDAQLDAIGTPEAEALRGKAAIANARLAYDLHLEVLQSDRWKDLAAAGATMQRPLWASTGVKDPAYDDTRYVVDLVGPGTVNTMPEATLDAVADHGEIRGETLTPQVDEAREVLASLERVGVVYDDVVHGLEVEGVQKFASSWEELLEGVRVALDEARR